jgi:crotonobetainyl-CoA:carnitine CoA-transferase CaiB-like acyl-CoA transferase
MAVSALHGVRVLDVTQVMAGPFCAMQLCDLGADVIKIEPPEGDSTRRMAGAAGTDSAAFNAVNRGKRGIVLNLKASAGREAFLHAPPVVPTEPCCAVRDVPLGGPVEPLPLDPCIHPD